MPIEQIVQQLRAEQNVTA